MTNQTPLSERLCKVLDELESVLNETENASTGA